MKVLLNGSQLCDTNSGVQYYCKHLFNSFQNLNEQGITINLYRRTLIEKHKYLFRLINNSRILRIVKENLSLPIFLKRNRFDLYHSPNYVLPLYCRINSVVTVHDLITFDFPRYCKIESVIYFRLFLPISLKKANTVIVVSNKTKQDILKRFKISGEKIEVVHLGISSIYRKVIKPSILTKYDIPSKYILFVGNIEPKKNLVRLINAYYKIYLKREITHKLVIVGKRGWKCNDVFKTVKDLKLENYVIFTGYIPERDMPVLYSMADLFAFPSLYEGFGIPPLEAMACETPVLTSNAGALPETTGGNCLMVDPYNIDQIADGIYALLTNNKIRMEYIEKGKMWSLKFDWKKTAKNTLDIYKKVK